MFGVKVYQMDYEAEIEFLGDARWHAQLGENNFQAERYQAPRPWAFDWGALGTGRVVRSGQRERATGQLVFERTERGWKGPDGQVH